MGVIIADEIDQAVSSGICVRPVNRAAELLRVFGRVQIYFCKSLFLFSESGFPPSGRDGARHLVRGVRSGHLPPCGIEAARSRPEDEDVLAAFNAPTHAGPAGTVFDHVRSTSKDFISEY